MKRMERITPAPQATKGLVQVAAYARISFETERTPLSLSAQISHYQTLIDSTPGWSFAGVYADSGLTGTNTNRPQFQQMLDEARAGNIDIILTKSISRFSRNTVDLLQIVRELKDLGVDVRFEKEGISSLNSDGEFMLTLLASFAQAESEQLSANVKWRVEKQFEQGLANGFRHYGYTSSPDGTDVEIIEEEAALVRRIYKLYLDEVSCETMSEIFEAEGIIGRSGEPIAPEVIRSWLRAEIFTGTMTLGRHHSPELGKHSVINQGEKPLYRVDNAVPAIIDRSLFDQVQEERQRRRELGARANWAIPTTCFTSRVKCGICGRSYSRSGKKNTQGEVKYVWICRTNRDKRTPGQSKDCQSKIIPEIILQEQLALALGIKEFDENVFEQRVEQIIMCTDQKMQIIFRDGQQKEQTWVSDLKKRQWTEDRKKAWSQRHKELWQDPEYRERILARRAEARARNKKPRRKVNAQGRANMRAAWTDERRKALSERNKAMWAKRSAEERSAMARRVHQNMSEETKAQRSKKLKAAWNDERRAKASQTFREVRVREAEAKRQAQKKAGEA
ncbi:recombinase family protein [Rothia sp. 32237D007AR]